MVVETVINFILTEKHHICLVRFINSSVEVKRALEKARSRRIKKGRK